MLLLALACTAGPDVSNDTGDTSAPRRCNGHAALCDRPFDEVTLPGTHNSMSNADAGWAVPNQQHGLTRQLEDGVRAFMLDTHDWNGEPYLCHSYCELGAQPLDEGFAEFVTFLDANPDEVILFLLEDYVSVEDTVAVMDAVGLTDLTYADEPPPGGWPTLGEMIDAGTRVVVTAQDGGPPPAMYHHAWDVLFDTPYDFASVDEFTCDLGRGDPASPLFLVNHWVEDPFPLESLAAEANAADVLGGRARACAERWGRPVNFLGVDLYATGDLFAVVDELNGVTE